MNKKLFMKRLLTLCIVGTLLACKSEPKDYATLSGKIENVKENKTLKVFNRQSNYEKTITINDDGTFKDTLKVEEGDYTFQVGNQYGQIFLKNDNESSFTAEYDSLVNTIEFKGDDSDTNNFSVQSFLIANDYFTRDLMTSGTKEELDTAIKNYQDAYSDLKNKYSDVDSTHVAIIDQNVKRTEGQVQSFMSRRLATKAALPKGSKSPDFVNYENHAGGNISLSDFKGKYVYIDVWATWCGPCIREIPSLKKVEEQYHDKNIAFVSISVDNGRGYKNDPEAAHEGWKKMVVDKDLGGIQLYADNGFQSQFVQDYKINGIPRFILIDPDGNIVSSDAPRPSSPALVKLFDELGI